MPHRAAVSPQRADGAIPTSGMAIGGQYGCGLIQRSGAARPGGRRTRADPSSDRRRAHPHQPRRRSCCSGPAAPAACDDFPAAPSSRWSIAAGDAGPVLLTPCGQPFFSLGVNGIDGGAEPGRGRRRALSLGPLCRKTAPIGPPAVRQRLLDWGFNTAGAWSLPPAEIGLPSTPELELGRSVQFVWTDPFDPALDAGIVRRAAVAAVAPYRGNPLRIGYFSDNEIGWWNGPLFVAFLTYPPENHTKQRLVAMLRERYRDDWQRFRARFRPGAGNRRLRRSARRPRGAASAPRRQRHRGGARLDRDRRRPLLQRDARGAARRRPGGALSRRPAADLLRPGRGARDGALCRRDLGQLQRRCRRRLDRAVFLRRAARSERRQAGADHRMVLRRGRKPLRQSEPHRSAARRRRMRGSATTATAPAI